MLKGLKEIEQLNVNEECLMDMEEILGELENRIAISDKTTSEKLTKGKKWEAE